MWVSNLGGLFQSDDCITLHRATGVLALDQNIHKQCLIFRLNFILDLLCIVNTEVFTGSLVCIVHTTIPNKPPVGSLHACASYIHIAGHLLLHNYCPTLAQCMGAGLQINFPVSKKLCAT